MAGTLATRLEKTIGTICNLLPKKTKFEQYGRACHTEGGDTIQAREIVMLGSDSQDMSFVRVCSCSIIGLIHRLIFFQYELLVDKYAHQPRRPSEFVPRTFFGQVLRFVVVEIPSNRQYDIEADTFIYAAIRKVIIMEPANDCCPINYYKNFGRLQFVDLNMVQCLVGHINDRNKWAIVDQKASQAKSNCSS